MGKDLQTGSPNYVEDQTYLNVIAEDPVITPYSRLREKEGNLLITQFILLGVILGFAAAIFQSFTSKERPQLAKRSYITQKPRFMKYSNPYESLFTIPSIRRNNLQHHRRGEEIRRTQPRWILIPPMGMWQEGKSLAENWQKSIVGLIDLASKNIESAEAKFAAKDYVGSLRTASTSIENISRALIYCCGGKPDISSGQEEALRLLSLRFSGEERRKFEEAIDEIALIRRCKVVLKEMIKKGVQIDSFEEQIRQALKSSSSVVEYFKRVLVDNFGEEIPQLASTDRRRL